jgi:NAD(P)-dependent dehydrogenase (short-subunit alcohol dehydrogenase family)
MGAHAASIQEAHGARQVCLQQIDLDDWSSLARAVEGTRQQFGAAPTHALVVFDEMHTDGPVHHARGGGDACARNGRLNVEAVYRTLQVLLPPMVAARAGGVVVMGSRLAERPWEGAGAAAFTASKAATLALVQAVAQEVLESGVRVNAVLEGIVDEPGARACVPQADHSRWVRMDSLVALISFLLSDEARDISGAGIPIYGRS